MVTGRHGDPGACSSESPQDIASPSGLVQAVTSRRPRRHACNSRGTFLLPQGYREAPTAKSVGAALRHSYCCV